MRARRLYACVADFGKLIRHQTTFLASQEELWELEEKLETPECLTAFSCHGLEKSDPLVSKRTLVVQSLSCPLMQKQCMALISLRVQQDESSYDYLECVNSVVSSDS